MALFNAEETAHVRDKMLYASSRDTLKKDLGRSFFVEDFFASDPSDMTFAHYSANNQANNFGDATRESLLTDAERAKREEARAEKDVVGSKDSVHGVSFKLTDSARRMMQEFQSQGKNWIALAINVKDETVDGVEAKTVDAGSLNANISSTEALFYFFRYEHKDKDDKNVSINLFIYCCPESVPVKAKMLASSNKGAVISHAQSLGINADKKVEITDVADFDIDAIYSELYPEAQKQKIITKSTRPGASARKLIKTKKDTDTQE
jgi:twinfilin